MGVVDRNVPLNLVDGIVFVWRIGKVRNEAYVGHYVLYRIVHSFSFAERKDLLVAKAFGCLTPTRMLDIPVSIHVGRVFGLSAEKVLFDVRDMELHSMQ